MKFVYEAGIGVPERDLVDLRCDLLHSFSDPGFFPDRIFFMNPDPCYD